MEGTEYRNKLLLVQLSFILEFLCVYICTYIYIYIMTVKRPKRVVQNTIKTYIYESCE